MSSINFDSIFGSLIELTRQRDQHALEVCLSRVLIGLAAPGVVRLYRVRETSDVPTFVSVEQFLPGKDNDNSPGEENICPVLRDAMQSCFKSGKHTAVALDGEKWMVYPLLGVRKNVVALIVIESAPEDEDLDSSVAMVLEIYQNFLALVNDNERDTLTGLLNRKTFEVKVGKAVAELQRLGHRTGDSSRREYCLSMLDIDHFKDVNDRYGHLYGDEVLLLLASLMTETFRETDQLYRLGGEEFVVLLRDVGLEQTMEIHNRLRSAVEAYEFPHVGHVTVSIGVTQVLPTDNSSTIIARADAALYYAKEHGRNQVFDYESLIAAGKLKASDRKPSIDGF
jgi:diguanylate cyclase (GGDEF)-like protein